MKQIIFGGVAGALVIMILLVVVTMSEKEMRQRELEQALGISVEDAVETTLSKKNYEISNNQEFLADFTQNLLVQLSNESEVLIEVAKLDYEKGLMSLRVTQVFQYPNKKEGKVSCETTAVFEQVEQEKELMQIVYELEEGVVYKIFQIQKDEKLLIPSIEPVMQGKQFVGWQNVKTKELLETEEKVHYFVTEPVTYKAIFQ